jgi:hypothetical protein
MEDCKDIENMLLDFSLADYDGHPDPELLVKQCQALCVAIVKRMRHDKKVFQAKELELKNTATFLLKYSADFEKLFTDLLKDKKDSKELLKIWNQLKKEKDAYG